MTTKFHVSPKTGKSEPCGATVQDCPVQPAFGEDPNNVPHFTTQAEADAYIEQKGKEQFGDVSTVSKDANTVDETLAKINAGNVSDEDAKALYGDVFKSYIAKVEEVEHLRKKEGVEVADLRAKMEEVNAFRDKIEAQGDDMKSRNFVIGTKKYCNTFVKDLETVAAQRAIAPQEKIAAYDQKVHEYIQHCMRPRF